MLAWFLASARWKNSNLLNNLLQAYIELKTMYPILKALLIYSNKQLKSISAQGYKK